MITRKRLEDAPMWTIFTGDAEDPGPVVWDVFSISAGEVDRKMVEFGVIMEMPQIDNNEPQPRYEADDLDAALAFLRSGGALCKVPDSADSPYWRLLVIEPMALADVFLRLISFDETASSVASLLQR